MTNTLSGAKHLMELAYDMVSRPQATTNAGPSLKVNQNLMKQGADDVREPMNKCLRQCLGWSSFCRAKVIYEIQEKCFSFEKLTFKSMKNYSYFQFYS